MSLEGLFNGGIIREKFCWYRRLLEWAFIGEKFLLVRAFIQECVQVSNYNFFLSAFIALRTFTRGGAF